MSNWIKKSSRIRIRKTKAITYADIHTTRINANP